MTSDPARSGPVWSCSPPSATTVCPATLPGPWRSRTPAPPRCRSTSATSAPADAGAVGRSPPWRGGAPGAPGFSWRNGRLVTERGGVRTSSFDVGGRRAEALSFGGSEHLALPRSYPRLRTIGTYLGWFGPLTKVVGLAGAAQSARARVPGVSGLLDSAASRLLPGSSGGPDAAARARTTSTFVAVARDSRGRELATVRLHGVDGYTLTGRLLAWGAQQLRDGVAPPPGARGPVEAFGLDPMARALADAGLPRVD